MFTLEAAPVAGIHYMRMARPPANAMRVEDLDRLHDALAAAAALPDCRVLVFSAAGRFFSAGADIKEMRAPDGSPPPIAALVDLARRMQSVFAAIEAFPAPTIAAIGGIAMGGGLELALACDFRIAATDARIGLTETRIGLIPGAGGTQRLTRVAGRGAALRLILTGEVVDGATATRLGIVHEATEAAELEARTLALASTLAALPAPALRAAKRCIALAPSEAGYKAEIEETERLHGTAETRAAITAFLDRSRR